MSTNIPVLHVVGQTLTEARGTRRMNMKMALSGRLIESRSGYTMNLHDFLGFAAGLGYAAVEIRYPQLPLETPPEQVEAVAARLRELNLTWSFGTVEGIIGDEALTRAVAMMHLHQRCGCRLTRFTVTKPEHIAWAQRFADEAARLEQRLVMQLHNGTLTDTVPHSIETLEQIGRPNVGLAFEACHIRFAGSEAYAEGIRTLGSRIFSVSLQNYKLAGPNDAPTTQITINGKAYVRALPNDPAGLDFAAIKRALRETGFNGFATVMADVAPDVDRESVARLYLEICGS